MKRNSTEDDNTRVWRKYTGTTNDECTIQISSRRLPDRNEAQECDIMHRDEGVKDVQLGDGEYRRAGRYTYVNQEDQSCISSRLRTCLRKSTNQKSDRKALQTPSLRSNWMYSQRLLRNGTMNAPNGEKKSSMCWITEVERKSITISPPPIELIEADYLA